MSLPSFRRTGPVPFDPDIVPKELKNSKKWYHSETSEADQSTTEKANQHGGSRSTLYLQTRHNVISLFAREFEKQRYLIEMRTSFLSLIHYKGGYTIGRRRGPPVRGAGYDPSIGEPRDPHSIQRRWSHG